MEKPIDLYAQGSQILDDDPERAIALLSKAIELVPTMVPAIYNRACAFGRLGKAREVLKDIEALDRLEPELAAQLRARFRMSALPSIEVAQSYWNAGELTLALQHFEIAAIYDPSCVEAIEAIAKLREIARFES